MKKYCLQVKWDFLKIKETYGGMHARIEDFGFAPIFEEFEDENGIKVQEWQKGWAQSITCPHDSIVGRWIKTNIENIYAKEKEKEDSKWIKEILEAGYEFDSENKLIENDKAKEDIHAQLCVMAEGDLRGLLFINVGGALELYDAETIKSVVGEGVLGLVEAKAIYDKRFHDKNRRPRKQR
jgi:hypothetical protein